MKLKLSLCSLILCAGLLACKEEKYHLPPDKMENVLLDIQLAEVYSTMAGFDTVNNIPAKSNDSLAKYYREVLQHHNITLDQFKKSLDYYRQTPDQLDSMYNRVQAKLTKEARALERARPAPKG